MTGLRVVDCGPGTTLQDRGRLGYRRFGVSTAGVMDRAASALQMFWSETRPLHLAWNFS